MEEYPCEVNALKSKAAVLNDGQTAAIIERGTAIQLTLYQEELTGNDFSVIASAKSFTVTTRDSVKRLRDLLDTFLAKEG